MKIIFLILPLLINSFLVCSQSIGINNDGSAPDASAMLDVKSSAKGLLIPRMSSQQRMNVQMPVKGLMVFDNDTNSFWFYNGASWVQVAGGGGAGYWALSGANIYKTNTGNVGVGLINPLAPIHIKNDNEALRIEGTTPYLSFHDNAGVRTGFLQSYNYNLFLGTPASNPNGFIQFYTVNNPVMTITPAGFVGIGTPTPGAPLAIKTAINSTGWTHTGGADSIIVSEGIGGVSASIGTSTFHAFRINAGGQGRLQIYPGGEVVVGGNNVGSFGKFTVQTLNNSYGISHLGEGGNILATRMGGTSAGIGTFSHTNMRILANNYSAIFIAEATGNVGIGTDNPVYKLSVNGTIRAKELRINTGWADYVFGNNYQLMPIAELAQFIQTHKRLPGILSADKLKKEGVDVSDMQTKMMAKIEELTLYMIEADKTIQDLKQRLAAVEKFKH